MAGVSASRKRASAGIAGGGCGALPVSSRPIVMTLSMGSAKTRTESVVVLTTPAVASVLVNGTRRVPTRVVPGLLYGLRAAHVVLPVHVIRSPVGEARISCAPEPRLLALAANGRPIATAPVIPHPAPGAMSSGPCRLTARGIPGLAPQWSHVASSIIAAPAGLVGPAFFSCIDVEYYLGKWPLDAAVLLDAAHPGSPPAAIPGLDPVPGHAGFFNGPGDFKGELTATTEGGGVAGRGGWERVGPTAAGALSSERNHLRAPLVTLLADRPTSETPAAPEPRQGVIEEARRRERARRLRRLSIALAATAIAALAAGLLLARGEAGAPAGPLHIPPEPAMPVAPDLHGAPDSVLVRVSPNLTGAEAGWCIREIFRADITGGCAPLPTATTLVISDGTSWGHGERDDTTVAVTAPNVRFVEFSDGRRRPALTEPGLPYGMRVAVLRTPHNPRPQQP